MLTYTPPIIHLGDHGLAWILLPPAPHFVVGYIPARRRKEAV